MQSILQLNQINKIFFNELGELKVLDNITFDLRKGEIIAIIGPSGSGKTTLLNVLAGLEKPTTGTFKLDGQMGYMFQKDQLLEWRTIWRNLLIGLEIKKQKTKENEQKVREMVERYELSAFLKNVPNELSGGMRQRIALIRTMVTKPNVLLLDEPFSALDYQTRLMVNDDIYQMIKTEGLSALLVTHDISEAIAMADRIIILSKRPARVKLEIPINLTIEDERTPYKARTAPEFSEYFKKVWQELNEEN